MPEDAAARPWDCGGDGLALAGQGRAGHGMARAWMRAWTVGLGEGNCVAEWVGGSNGMRSLAAWASFNPATRVFPLSLRHTDDDLADRLDSLDVLEVPDMPDVLPVPDKTRHTAVRIQLVTVDRQDAVCRLPSAVCHAATTMAHAMPCLALPCPALPCQPRRRRSRPIRHAPSPRPSCPRLTPEAGES
jgi:hypothetical protein